MLHHQALLSRPEVSQCFHVPVPERRGRPMARRVHNLEKREARHVDDAVCTRDVGALEHNHAHTTVSLGSHAGTWQQLGVALMVSPLTIVELRHRVGGHRVVAVWADRRGEPLEVVWRAAVVGNVRDLLRMYIQHND